MTIELSREDRQQAITSIERYFQENMDEPIGNVAAGGLLGYMLEEIGPCIYNQAVVNVQERHHARVAEDDFWIHQAAFGYWRSHDTLRKAKPSEPGHRFTSTQDRPPFPWARLH